MCMWRKTARYVSFTYICMCVYYLIMYLVCISTGPGTAGYRNPTLQHQRCWSCWLTCSASVFWEGCVCVCVCVRVVCVGVGGVCVECRCGWVWCWWGGCGGVWCVCGCVCVCVCVSEGAERGSQLAGGK